MCLWSVSWCCQINVLSLARVRAPALGCAKHLPLLRQITATLEVTELFVHWKGWPCHMRLESGEKNTSDVLIETLKILTLCILPILNANEISFLHWGLSARRLQCLPSHLVPRLPASFDKLLCLLKISDKVFLHRTRTGKKSCQQN